MKLRVLLAAVLVIGLVPAISAIAEEPVCPTVKAPDIAFDPPSFIDTKRAGGEPVSVVAQDGSIIVAAHAGTTHVYKDPNAAPGAGDFLIGYGNQTLHWRSTDGGKTWKYIGLMGQDLPGGQGQFGPHTPQSTGFSDPDLTIDQGGRIYDVEIDLGNDAVFSSVDDGQSYPHGNPFAWMGDRPWLTGLEKDEVYLYINSYTPVPSANAGFISRDGGLTFTKLPNPAISSKAVVDPLNPNDGMIGPDGLGRFAISGNDGQSWETFDFGPLGRASQFFGVVGADSAGNVYQSAAGGYNAWNDATPNGEVSFTYYERATGEVNEEQITIPSPPGDALWPWIIAGDDGRVAVVWYQNLAGAPTKFYAFAAVTHNAHGTDVTCSDGSTKHVPPQFTVVNASGRPIHEGHICLDGTTCNANPSFDGGDRRLGDFFSVNFTHKGELFIVSGDTTLKSATNGKKPVGNPIFIKQSSGDLMLEEPNTLRPSRTLCNNPVTCT